MAVDPATYSQLVTAFLGILVLAGIVSSPTQGMRLTVAGHLSFNGAVLKSYALWVSIFAFILLALQAAHVPISITAYNQLVALFLQILVLAGIVNSPGPAQVKITEKDSTWNAAKDMQVHPDPPVAPASDNS